MMFKLSNNSKERRKGVDPRLIEISDLAIQITLVDFGHGPDSGIRTEKRQNELYREGKSKLDGFEKKSFHQTGRALDFYAFVDGKASWDEAHLAMVASAFLQAAGTLGHSVSWGGLWQSSKGGVYGWDMPHIELSD